MNKPSTLKCLVLGALTSSVGQAARADFIEGSHANLALRNLYFNNDYRDRPGPAGQSKTEEWAQGFMLNYTSGFTAGTLGFGVDALAFQGVTLNSGAGNHRGSSMIPDDGTGAADQWSRLGLTGKARLGSTEARLGTLQPKLPILVSNDGRLLPQTFQGGQVTSNDIDNLTLTAGRLDQATGRASTDRTGLAVNGATRQSNDFVFAGADYKVTKDLIVQYYVANLEDYYTQQFFGLQHVLALGKGQSFKTDLRYFDTDSSGANGSASGRAEGYRVGGYTRNSSGEIDNRTWSAMFTYTLGGHALTGGYQSVSDDSNFVQLNQGTLPGKGAAGSSVYLFTDRMLASFTRAGERTRFGQYAYDFAALGVPGLRASMVYLKGDDIKTAVGGDKGEWERDLALDYVIQDGTFKGVGFGWRYGALRSQIDPHQDQNRLIVSYTLSLF
ncbi:OprD family porin [Pseudomonas sp. R5(2019)]|uniref:OprD family porin n=1 Tax=Pseudomonas sp. R5(2019) TaxID=2697566 RepID=UPI0014125B0E|nr:OprD family porin [Pseudomonas sp. R5(2019)]NBA94819.1 outer membrane porin, OprD family [Pseudomonas sp. R5(2019)]